MKQKKTPRRRSSDYTDGYKPLEIHSSQPEDLNYVKTNIPCQWACPARTDIPGYIQAIHRGNYAHAYTINRKANLFPAILGRVCSRPCENFCRHGESDLGQPVAICGLKRVAADYVSKDYHVSEQMFAPTGKTVAVVGGGPGGLAAARHLAIFGHRVTIYEAMPKLGGMLLYGIPDFRVPPKLVEEEVYNILRLGVQVQCNTRLGKDITLEDLRKKHDAVVIAMGCYAENRLNIPGEELEGVYKGLDFMMRVNQYDPPPVGKRVAVIGGGFTAMDCSRSALRLGAKEVVNYIRRTEAEIAVTREEIFETKKEGISFVSLVSPVAIHGKERVEAVEFCRNRLEGSGKQSGKRPVAIPESEFTRQADTVIVAIGQKPDLKPAWTNKKAIPVFDESGAGDLSGVFLAGDCSTGATTVIEAIGHAQNAAVLCDTYLVGRKRRQWLASSVPATDTERKRDWDFLPREEMPTLLVAERLADGLAEVETGYDREKGNIEASRCYLCNLRYNIHLPDCIYCRWCIERCPRDCIHMAVDVDLSGALQHGKITKTDSWNDVAAIVIDSDRCIRCGECLRICPTQCIHVTKISLHERLNSQPEEADNE